MIATLAAEQVPGQKFRIYGKVTDDTPASCSVSITGVATGSAPCDATGNFSKVFDVANLGQIQAVASDGSQQSPQSSLVLYNSPPAIQNFKAVGGPNNTWTFSGTVTDEARAGLTVTLAGPGAVQGKTATVQANGTFSVTVSVTPGTSGMVTATVTDWYGQVGMAFTTF